MIKLRVFENHRMCKLLVQYELPDNAPIPKSGEEIYVDSAYREITKIIYDFETHKNILAEIDIEVNPIEAYEY